ncbi:ABC transporter ATP-binding protein [Algirhabdus cladophorae]|uniref:ABC transporter ATP-binding protein n=1 Tax=Algirhabdus cladophorae TaxID=3377108 RepID=UPI003B845698
MPQNPDPILQLSAVQYSWIGSGGFGITVPDFSLAPAESVLLLGESGSGKSTLLSLICGIVTPRLGSVHIAGTQLDALSAGQRDRFRAEHIGLIFQQFNLLPYAGVLDNIALPLAFAPQRKRRAAPVQDTALKLCTELGLPAGVTQAKAGNLSVGQQQRVAVARALIGMPPLIVADEPTSALDASSQEAFLNLLFTQTKAMGSALLMVSHDARLGDRFDRVIQMSDIAQTTREAA